jgi:hypothetical protein
VSSGIVFPALYLTKATRRHVTEDRGHRSYIPDVLIAWSPDAGEHFTFRQLYSRSKGFMPVNAITAFALDKTLYSLVEVYIHSMEYTVSYFRKENIFQK